MSPSVGDIEAAAAIAAGVLESAVRSTNQQSPDPRPKIVRSLEDPRDAAAAAAWWALSRDGKSEKRWTLALGEPAPPARPGAEVPSMQQQTQRFRAAVAKVRASRAQPVVELRGALERGQGEFWVLGASPCAVTERVGEVGLTSTLLVSQLIGSATRDGVSLEPWIDPDGAGYFAHAAPRDGESPEQLARRVASALGHALLVNEPSKADHERAQLVLLERAATRVENRTFAMATWLAPVWPSKLAPLGSPESLARAGYAGVVGRFHALASGPIRLAVLAPDSADQPAIAQSELDSLATVSGESRTCPVVASESPSDVSSHAWASGSSAIGVRVDVVAGSSVFADISFEMLSASEGSLRRSLPANVSWSVQRADAGSLRSWVAFLSGDAAEVDVAIAKVREYLGVLAKGGAVPDDLERAWTIVQQRYRQQRSTRSYRLVELWRGATPTAVPTIEGLRAWQTANLRAESAVVVRPLAP
jgi:hypothetical protein